jgi:limonene-1,2-epoxide hydrolase
MIARLLAAFVMLVTLASLNAPTAQASVEPIFTVDSFFAALNAGDHEAAVAAFTPDAVATLARGETYRGQSDIVDLVQLMERPGGHYEIVRVRMTNDTVTMDVEVSNQGIRWGEATIVAEVQGGKLHTFHEKSFRLRLGS